MMNLSGNCCAEKFVVSNFCLSTEAMKINTNILRMTIFTNKYSYYVHLLYTVAVTEVGPEISLVHVDQHRQQ